MKLSLTENAMHSLEEAIDYYHVGKEDKKLGNYKFAIILICHCAELLLKQILVNEHEVLIYENIDSNKDFTIGFQKALERVKRICKKQFHHHEKNLCDLAKMRNTIMHYEIELNEAESDRIMQSAFSAIQYIVIDILHKTFDDFGEYICSDSIEILNEYTDMFMLRKKDISKRIRNENLLVANVKYAEDKSFMIPCPNCNTISLIEDGHVLRCLMCGSEYNSYEDVHDSDYKQYILTKLLRELGRRTSKYNIKECSSCNYKTLIKMEDDKWKCLNCNEEIHGTLECEECCETFPHDNYYMTCMMSDIDCNNYRYLCHKCANEFTNSEEGIGFNNNTV